MKIEEQIRDIFVTGFQEQPKIFRAPGRINLIGEHTDYNLGFVLPAAIDKAAYLAIAPSKSKSGHWISVDFKEQIDISLENIKPLPNHWANYLLGVVQEFRKAGHEISAFNCVIAADIPIGAGLSSSAAVETVLAIALNDLFGCGLSRMELARLTQRAENQFIGLQCGIMDMFVSLHGKEHHVLRLDCRSLEYEYFPLQLGFHKILLLDTGVKHSLAGSEYNVRRGQCEKGVEILKSLNPSIQSLRDVNKVLLENGKSGMDDLIYRRCRFVVDENERVFATCQALQNGDLGSVGKLMYQSHYGLQHHYEVSCRELDLLVNLVKNEPGVLGARMMGGGFGGCTINLVAEDEITRLLKKIVPIYEKQTGHSLKHYEVVTAPGAGAMDI